MNNRGKSYSCTVNNTAVNNDMACVSTEIAYIIYDKVENNQVLSLENIKQGIQSPEKKKQCIEIDKEQVKNPYETLLL